MFSLTMKYSRKCDSKTPQCMEDLDRAGERQGFL